MSSIAPSSQSSPWSPLPPWLRSGWGILATLAIIYTLINIAWTRFHWGGPQNVTLFTNLFSMPPSLLAALVAWRVGTHPKLTPRLRRAWFLLGTGFLMFFIGNIVWAYLEVVLFIEPFPSAADIFYLAFYPFVLWGILSLPNIPQNRRDRLAFSLDLLGVMLAASMFVGYFIIVPTAALSNGDLLTQILAPAYPISSLILLGGTLATLYRRPSRDMERVLLFLLTGIVVFLASDFAFGYTSLIGSYTVGGWTDAGWNIAQLFFMLAALSQMQPRSVTMTESRRMPILQTLMNVLPLITVLLSFGFVFYLIAVNFSNTAGWLLIGSVVLAILFITRQMFAPGFIHISVRAKLILTFLLVGLFSIGLVAFFTYVNLRSNIELDIGVHMKTEAEIQAQALGHLVSKQSDALEGFVLVEALRDPIMKSNAQYTGSVKDIQTQLQQQNLIWRASSDRNPFVQNVLSNETSRELHHFLEIFPSFTDVLITNKYGAVIAATSRPTDYSQAEEEWWQATYDQDYGTIYFGQPVFAPKGNTKSMIIAMPIEAPSGNEFIGVLRVVYNLQDILDLLATPQHTTHADLLLPDGKLLTPSGEIVSLDSNTIARLSETSGATYVQIIFEGGLQFVSQARVRTPDPKEVSAFDHLNWTLITHQNLKDALAPVTAAWRIASLSIIVVLILTTGAAVFLAQLFVAPISRLTAVARQITSGDLSAKAQVESRDEIGTLAGTFNSMLEALSKTQQELRESEALYRSLVDYSPDMILVHRQGSVLFVNPAGVKLLGARSTDQLLGHSLLNMVPAQVREFLQIEIEQAQETMEVTSAFQERMYRLDGTSFEAEFTAIPITYAGEPAIQFVMRDITERKRAEDQIQNLLTELEHQKEELEVRVSQRTEELYQLNQRLQDELSERQRLMESLRDSEARFHLLFAASPDAILLLDPTDGNISWPIVDCNEAACAMNGYSREELIRQSIDVLNATPGDPAERQAYLQFLREEGVLHRDGIHRHKDGHLFPVEVSSSLVSFAGREMVLGIDRDITERKHAEEALKQAKEAAEESRRAAEAASRAKSEFLSRMSHELRTPMNAILGFAQLLEMSRKEPLSSTQKERVKQIVKGGQHLLDLINEILDISRIEANRLQISPEPVSIRESIQEALDLTVPLAVKRQIQIVTRTGTIEDNSFVMADRQRLKQVLLNLLSNAVKYNYDGGSVIISCEQVPSNRWRISIADTGPGISQENQARLFIPFERLGADQPNVEGTGLGLVLAKRLVELMNGQLGVESILGKGSTFWIELPIVESPVQQLERVGGTGQLPVLSATARTILYVEDNVANFELVRQVLADYTQIELLWAADLKTGIQLASERKLDLVLLDVHLSGMDGGAILQQLKWDRKTAELPVVVISADATPGQIERLLSWGAHSFLTKPLDVKQFVRLIEELLAEKEV
jgi:PAS domain S-box-containing protein